MRELVANLEQKLGKFAEVASGPDDADVARSWREMCRIEARCVYDSHLLHLILSRVPPASLLPFQLCSVAIFVLPINPFTPSLTITLPLIPHPITSPSPRR